MTMEFKNTNIESNKPRPSLAEEMKLFKKKMKDFPAEFKTGNYVRIDWDSKNGVFGFKTFDSSSFELNEKEKSEAEVDGHNIYNKAGELVFDFIEVEKERTKKQNEDPLYQDFLIKEKTELNNYLNHRQVEESLNKNSIKNRIFLSYFNEHFYRNPDNLENGKLTKKQKLSALGINTEPEPILKNSNKIEYPKRIYKIDHGEFKILFDGTDPDEFFTEFPDVIIKYFPRDIRHISEDHLIERKKEILKKEEYRNGNLVIIDQEIEKRKQERLFKNLMAKDMPPKNNENI